MSNAFLSSPDRYASVLACFSRSYSARSSDRLDDCEDSLSIDAAASLATALMPAATPPAPFATESRTALFLDAIDEAMFAWVCNSELTLWIAAEAAFCPEATAETIFDATPDAESRPVKSISYVTFLFIFPKLYQFLEFPFVRFQLLLCHLCLCHF